LASSKKIQALEAEVEALRKRCRDMNTQYKEQRRNVLDRLQEIKAEVKSGQSASNKKFAEWRDHVVVCFTYGMVYCCYTLPHGHRRICFLVLLTRCTLTY
jgi:hypothetical protein